MWAALLCLAAGIAAQNPAAAPESAPSNSLARARAIFRALDGDADGQLSSAELGAFLDSLPGGGLACDTNRDRLLSRDEFVLAYRAFLRAQGQIAAADLDGEAARIEALRRIAGAPGVSRTGPARAPFAARAGARTGLESESRSAERDETSRLDPRRVRADAACDDLARALAAGDVHRGAFERLRVLLVLDAESERALTALSFRARVAGLSRRAAAALELELRTWYDRLWNRETKTARQVSPAAPSRSR